MSSPTILQHVRQIVGRALRETGQALDRISMLYGALAVTPHYFFDPHCIYDDHLSRHRHQFPLLHAGRPLVSKDAAFLAPCSTLIGSVHVSSGCSVWYGAVLRGDYCENAVSFQLSDEELAQQAETFQLDERRHQEGPLGFHGGAIFVGPDTNLQDGTVVTARQQHTRIGQGVTVGHLAQIHSATIGDFCLIGMGSVVCAGAVIEDESFIAAGAVVGENQVVGSGELWVGNPARKIRDLTDAERQHLHYQSSEYVKVAATQKSVEELGGNLVGGTSQLLPTFRLLEEARKEAEEEYFSYVPPEPEEEGPKLTGRPAFTPLEPPKEQPQLEEYKGERPLLVESKADNRQQDERLGKKEAINVETSR